MTDIELQEIARIEISSGGAGDEGSSLMDLQDVHDLNRKEAKRVLELIDTATITITWEG